MGKLESLSNLQNNTYIAKTFLGLEEVLAKEIESVGGEEVEILNRAVSFKGDNSVLYRAHLSCNTALRFLKSFFQFSATDEHELYDGIQTIVWGEYFSYIDTFKIDTVVNSKYFSHSLYVAHKTKDAIVDQFGEKYGRRPNVDLETPKYTINVTISDDVVRVSWDCTGDSLHKRGYRVGTGPAPINEVLAAGLIKLSGWNGEKEFIDPMCGSGTILIEAAMIASNTSPNIKRKHFAFMEFEDFDRRAWMKIKNETKRGTQDPANKIKGYDKSWRLLEVATQNILESGMDEYISISKQDFFGGQPKTEEGVLLFNPPYGERLDREEVSIDQLYQDIGDKLKQHYQGFDVWIITSNLEALKHVGLRTKKRHIMYNGGNETRFVHYEMYEGTRKEK